MAAKKKKNTRTSKKTDSKAVKSTPKIKSAKSVSSPKSENMHASTLIAPADKPQVSQMKIRKGPIIALIVILVIVGLLYLFRGQFVAATVNGQPISRAAYNSELEKNAGKKVLDSLVTKTIILQEASKEHVSVSDAEVNDEIKKIQSDLSKQGQKLDQALALRGLTMADLKEQIKVQKLIEKMLGKDIQVSDKEIDAYIQKTQLPADQSGSTTPTPPVSRSVVKQQLQQEKLSAKFQPWLQKLQSNAKINYFVNVSGQTPPVQPQ